MKDRIKLIRKNAGLTQQEFASKIATYETSVRIPIDAIVKSLCREFDVNEVWLRTGEGSMYVETNPDLALSKWFGHLLRENPTSFKKRFIMTLSKLSDNEWKMLEKMVDTLHSKEI